MATREQLSEALINADRAGDIDAARALAAELRRVGYGEKDRSFGEEAVRKGEFAARGFSDSVLEAIGAIPDLTAAGMRKVGLPAPEAGFYANKLKEGYGALGRTLSAPLTQAMPDVMAGPMSTADKLTYGAGRGAGDVASFIAPAAAVSRAARAGGLAQRTAGELASQPALQTAAGMVGGSVGEATDNPYLGTAAAIATPFAVAGAKRVITPIHRQLTGEEQRLAALAEQMGIKLTAGQATGTTPLQVAESSFTRLPFTSEAQKGIYAQQRAAFNRAVLEKAGINADSAAPNVLDDAFRNIGNRFDDLAARTRLNVDRQFHDDIAAAASEYGRRLPTNTEPVFQSYMDDFRQMANAASQPGVTGVQIEGDVYKNIASSLRKSARNAKNSNPELADALDQLSKALDNLVERSATPQLKSEWGDVRRQYRNLKIIDDAMKSGTQSDRTAGNIPFKGFDSAVRRSDSSGYARGRGEMNDLARVGMFLADKIPNSGTHERMFITAPLAGGLGATALGVDPVTAIMAAASTYGAPKLAQALLNSGVGQAYLRNTIAASPTVSGSLLAKILLADQRGSGARFPVAQP